MYQNQLFTEENFSKRNINQWIKEDMGDLSQVPHYQECVKRITEYLGKDYYKSKNERISLITKEPSEIALDLFFSILSLNGNVSPIQAVSTTLGLRLGLEQLDAVKCGAEIIAVCKDTEVYDLYHAFDTENELETASIKPHFQLERETSEKVHMAMYLPPMLCEPREWTDNKHGGLLLEDSSCILGAGNHHNLNQATDTLNLLQSVKWTLVEHIIFGEEELPKEPLGTEDPDELRKIEQHNMRCEQSQMVYEYLENNDNEFYFQWKFDKRGRMYSQGYDVNLQGSEYKKASITFAEAEMITTQAVA